MSKVLSKDFLSRFGVVRYGYTTEDIPISFEKFEKWIEEGGHGSLHYLSDYRKEKRASLKNIYPGFESALVFLFSYQKERTLLQNFYKSVKSNGLKIASYLFGFGGEDYHQKIGRDLQEILKKLKEENDGLDGVLSLDIHPVLERDLAYRAGLGWFGKNSMLIDKKHGSFLMIGALLLNKKLELDKPIIEADHCGTCRACIDACPTLAIDENARTIKSDQCISTYTIELFKDAAPPVGYEKVSSEIYGCDICQDVCPWNIKLEKNFSGAASFDFSKSVELSLIHDSFLKPSKEDILSKISKMSKRSFRKTFSKTPIARTGRDGMMKNIKALLK